MPKKAIIKIPLFLTREEIDHIRDEWKHFVESEQPEVMVLKDGCEIAIGDFSLLNNEPILTFPNGEIVYLKTV